MSTLASSPTDQSHQKSRRIQLTAPLVSRLMGLETEYGTLVADRQDLTTEDLPSARLVYSQICEAIRRDQPTASGLFDCDQMFLANGAAVTFESHPSVHSLPGGLIEIATPEVHSPSELLACQRAIDELAEDATGDSETSFDLRILKNSSDALGHVYGCHENYETEVATGLMLVIYRGFVLLLWLMQIVTLVVSLPLVAAVISLSTMVRYFRYRRRSQLKPSVDIHREMAHDHDADFDDKSPLGCRENDDSGEEFIDDDPFSEMQSQADLFDSLPRWMSASTVALLRLIHLPIVMVLLFVTRHVAFRRQQRYLTAMLVSRVALCGAGHFDIEGRYSMSAKAMAIDSVSHMGGFQGERPIFIFGHWLGQYCAKSFVSLGSTRQMLSRHQRLQISLSDSNLSDLAEYVKVGSVSLVLDMIENGFVDGLPTLKKPLEATHRIASDWNLVSRVETSRGPMTALQIQKCYLKAAIAFVDAAPGNMLGEARLVLYRWTELFEAAQAFRDDANDVDRAIGRIDWLTKRYLIDQLGEDAHWEERKKIDLRYHELSDEGYFRQVIATFARSDLRLTSEDVVNLRRRSPPANSPAARRSWLIREFSGGDETVQSEWTYAMVGRGRKRRRINFANRKR